MSIKNSEVISLHEQHGLKKCSEIINQKYDVNIDSLKKKITRLFKKKKTINKSKGRENTCTKLQSLENEDFIVPKTNPPAPKKRKIDNSKFMVESLTIATETTINKLTVTEEENDNLKTNLNSSLCDLQNLSTENKTIQKHNSKLQKKVIKLKSDNTGKNVIFLKKKLTFKTHVIKLLRLRNNYYQKSCNELNRKLKLYENEAAANKCYVEEIENRNNDFMKIQSDSVHDLLEENEWLRNTISDDKILKTIGEDKRYLPEIRKCVYELLDNNVSARKVAGVIRGVLKLVNKEAPRLPCKSTILNMNLQRLALCHVQIAEVFVEEENTCLLTDETSKHGKKYMGYEACDNTGKFWVLGLREIATKSANDTLHVFQQILSDIDLLSNVPEKSKLLLRHITSTMSDRAATETKFNRLLEEFRTQVLPLLPDAFGNLNDEQGLAVSALSNFFCGLHSLVHIAEASNKSLIEAEKGLFGENIVPVPSENYTYNNSESGTTRLIRTASKAFAAGADEKSGCYSVFSIYVLPFLKEKKLRSIPLTSFRGSRFNILVLYFLHEQMVMFLQQYGTSNLLLKAVLKDLEVTEFKAGLKTLGIISKHLTCPLWHIIEDKTVNIVDMNQKYSEFIAVLEAAAKNPRLFLDGEIYFGDYILKDAIWESLFLPSDIDPICETILSIVLPAISVVCKKLFVDHIDGKHSNLDVDNQEVRDKYKSVPKSSVYAESVFGQLDYMLQQKPRASTVAVESFIMFSQNKTLEWLYKKNKKQQEILLNNARKEGSNILKRFRERKLVIQEERLCILKDKIRKAEEIKQKRQNDLETFTQEMIEFGLWQNEQEVDTHIKLYTTKAHKLRAIKSQLRFRQHVFKQIVSDKSVYAMTKNRVQLTPEELIKNIKKLVCAASNENPTDAADHTICGKTVTHKFVTQDQDSTKEEWFRGKVISQKCRNHQPVVKCTPCRSEFHPGEKGATNSNCRHCTHSLKVHGEPSVCKFCNLMAAFVNNRCLRCTSSEKKFGSPSPCEQCKMKCAFDTSEHARKKVDGKVLCWLCTLAYKRVLAKARQRHEEKKQSLLTANRSSYDKLDKLEKVDTLSTGSNSRHSNGGDKISPFLDNNSQSSKTQESKSLLNMSVGEKSTPPSFASSLLFLREHKDEKSNDSADVKIKEDETKEESTRSRHHHHHHHHHKSKHHKRSHSSSHSPNKRGKFENSDLNDMTGTLTPTKSSMLATEKSPVDPNSSEHIIAINKLQEQLNNMKRQLSTKDQQLLEKEKTMTDLKAAQYESEKLLRAKILELTNKLTSSSESLQNRNRELEKKNRDLMKQVVSLSKGKKSSLFTNSNSNSQNNSPNISS